tara:strand:- start:239 stop:1399 length:1161 start_codon:yes stop_codon:yes gene_type:complete
MKIGIFVSAISGQKGFEKNVSGHIQVPLQSITELVNGGHEVHLITNSFSEDRSIPFCLPDGIKIHYVADARNRGGILERKSNQKESVNLFKLLRQVSSMKQICKDEQFDVLHVFGYNRTAYLAGGLRLFGLKTPVVVTMFAAYFPEKFSFLKRILWNRISSVVTATSYVQSTLTKQGIETKQVRHGIIRKIDEEHDGSELSVKHRVLFWRDLTVHNGADVALAAYLALANKYPDVQFDFAVRPHWDELKDVDSIIEDYPNICLYRFPYQDGITLPKLLLESICVMMPIRDISIDPQLVIAESLAVGVPVIATDQRSNPEFVIENETGKLIPLDDNHSAIDALDAILSNRENALKMGEDAKSYIEKNWNWKNYVNEIVDVYRRVSEK